jgi:hypothetical protein
MKNPILTMTAALFAAVGSIQAQQEAASPPPNQLQEAVSKWVLPKVDFREATVREALEFLAMRAKAVDPEGQGVNIILKDETPSEQPPPNAPGIPGLDAPAAAAPPAPEGVPKVTLTLNKVPLTEVFKYIGNLANHRIRWDEHAVVFIAPKPGKKDLPPAEPRPELKVAAGGKAAVDRLKKIVLPKVSFKEATAEDAFDFLSQRGKALDPEGAPVNFIVKLNEAKNVPKVTFDASKISLLETARYTAEMAGLEMTVELHAVVISAPKKP